MNKNILKRIAILLLFCMVVFSVTNEAVAADKKGPGQPEKTIAGKPGPSADQVHLDFNDVDIKVFIQFISGITGKNFIIDNKVRGKISIISPDAISIKEAYDVFESVLALHGFAAVKAGKLVKVVPAKTANQKNIVTKLKLEAVDINDHVITQLIPLKYADPAEIKRLFTPLVSKNSSILSYGPTNSLIVTDLSSNIFRLLKILDAIDVTGIGQEITVIPLQFADAKNFNSLLSTVFKAQKTTSSKKSSTLKNVKFVADDRTNSIVVLASKGDTERIINLVKMLDLEVPRGKEKIHVYYLENATAEELAKVLQSLSQKKTTATKGKAAVIKGDNLQITADKSTNSLIIIAEKTDYTILESIIKKLDIPRTMVYVECLIMEVNIDKNFSVGTEWTVGEETTVNGNSTAVGMGFDGGSSYSNLAGLAGVTTGVSTLPAGYAMGVFSESITIGDVAFSSLGAVINAYKQDEEVKILSTPQILTTDNEEASISVGKKIPYLTKDVTGETNYNNYEYKDVGISLKVTPQINKDRKIIMKIAQETSRILGDATSLSPSTLKRTIDTTVVIDDGNTIVIGGLIDESVSDSVYKVPCLGDIPIVRYFFSSMGKSDSMTNLYIFLTPHVVGSEAEAKRLQDKKLEEIKAVKTNRIQLYPGERDKSDEKTIDMGVLKPLNEEPEVKTDKEE